MSYFSVKFLNFKTLLRLKERTHALKIALDAGHGIRFGAENPFTKKNYEFYTCESMVDTLEDPGNTDHDMVKGQLLDYWTLRLNLFDNVQYLQTITDPTMEDSSSLLLLHYIGNWDLSANLFPVLGGTGPGGAVARGDVWDIVVGGVPGGLDVPAGATIWAKVAEPGQDLTKWKIIY